MTVLTTEMLQRDQWDTKSPLCEGDKWLRPLLYKQANKQRWAAERKEFKRSLYYLGFELQSKHKSLARCVCLSVSVSHFMSVQLWFNWKSYCGCSQCGLGETQKIKGVTELFSPAFPVAAENAPSSFLRRELLKAADPAPLQPFHSYVTRSATEVETGSINT